MDSSQSKTLQTRGQCLGHLLAPDTEAITTGQFFERASLRISLRARDEARGRRGRERGRGDCAAGV
jgi:hypothetical protein